MLSPTSLASRAGSLISMTLTLILRSTSSSSSSRSLSTSAPRGPITMPGRAVCRVTFTSLRVRAISTLETAAIRRLAVELLVHELADLLVFDQELAVVGLGGKPCALPAQRDPCSEPDWRCLLTHTIPATL